MQQLSLWQENDALPAGHVPVPEIGGTIQKQYVWAGGNSSSADLERLARVIMLDHETIHHNGEIYWFYVAEAHVEGDHVSATWKRIEPLFRRRSSSKCEEEEEDF